MQDRAKDSSASAREGQERDRERHQASVGGSISISGDLMGDEDLTIEGKVKGKIELKNHNLTIGVNGRIEAEVFAKSVVIMGNMIGDVNASERVEIKESGSLQGNIRSPRLFIADGARFKGSVDMERAAAVETQIPGLKRAKDEKRDDEEPLEPTPLPSEPDKPGPKPTTPLKTS